MDIQVLMFLEDLGIAGTKFLYFLFNSSLYKASVDKIVLIVIDAMRVDFLSNESMPHVAKLLDSRYGCLFHSNVKSPTVTLPRIKVCCILRRKDVFKINKILSPDFIFRHS